MRSIHQKLIAISLDDAVRHLGKRVASLTAASFEVPGVAAD
jgi:hypothetical protein